MIVVGLREVLSPCLYPGSSIECAILDEVLMLRYQNFHLVSTSNDFNTIDLGPEKVHRALEDSKKHNWEILYAFS